MFFMLSAENEEKMKKSKRLKNQLLKKTSRETNFNKFSGGASKVNKY